MGSFSIVGGLVWLAATLSPQPVRSPDDAAALCQMLDENPPLESMLPREPVARAQARKAWMDQREHAREATYEVDLPVRSFRLGRYEPEARELTLVPQWPLHVAANALLLSPEDRADFALSGQPSEVGAAYRHWQAGEGSMRVRFRAAEGGCSGRLNSGAYLLNIEPVSVEYLAGDGASWLRGSGGLQPAAAPGGKPSVRVESVVVEQGRVNQPALEAALNQAPGLVRCYQQALADRPDLEGVAVFRGAVGSAGRASDLTLALDGLGVAPLVSCLRQQLARVRLPGAVAGARLFLPLELSLQ